MLACGSEAMAVTWCMPRIRASAPAIGSPHERMLPRCAGHECNGRNRFRVGEEPLLRQIAIQLASHAGSNRPVDGAPSSEQDNHNQLLVPDFHERSEPS